MSGVQAPPRGLARRLRSTFFTGLFLVVPFVVTIFAARILFGFADGTLRPTIIRFTGVDFPGLFLEKREKKRRAAWR